VISSAELCAALDRVPVWDSGRVEVEALEGGLTNRTYRVTQGGRTFAMRLDVEEAQVLPFDRRREVAILDAAHAAGIGPEPVFADPENGVLVTAFLKGRSWDTGDMRSLRQLDRLAALLREVHRLPLSGVRLEHTEQADAYERFLARRRSHDPLAARCAGILRQVKTEPGRAVCCHNDIVAANVIDDGELRLIDWEYACDNDPLFDLASAIGFHDLDEAGASHLLDAYVGGATAEQQERLVVQVRAFDALQWLWLAARELVMPRRWQRRRLEILRQRIG